MRSCGHVKRALVEQRNSGGRQLGRRQRPRVWVKWLQRKLSNCHEHIVDNCTNSLAQTHRRLENHVDMCAVVLIDGFAFVTEIARTERAAVELAFDLVDASVAYHFVICDVFDVLCTATCVSERTKGDKGKVSGTHPQVSTCLRSPTLDRMDACT